MGLGGASERASPPGLASAAEGGAARRTGFPSFFLFLLTGMPGTLARPRSGRTPREPLAAAIAATGPA